MRTKTFLHNGSDLCTKTVFFEWLDVGTGRKQFITLFSCVTKDSGLVLIFDVEKNSFGNLIIVPKTISADVDCMSSFTDALISINIDGIIYLCPTFGVVTLDCRLQNPVNPFDQDVPVEPTLADLIAVMNGHANDQAQRFDRLENKVSDFTKRQDAVELGEPGGNEIREQFGDGLCRRQYP